jgi:hypothetical protein
MRLPVELERSGLRSDTEKDSTSLTMYMNVNFEKR